jgi:putative ABC transport system permease protein
MLRLAFRNVFRHRLRTALTLSVIIAGVASLILSGGFVEDSLLQLREATIHSQIGHLQIYRAGYYEHGQQSPYRFLIDKPAEMLGEVGKLPVVEDAMARLAFSGVLNNGKTDLPVAGFGLEVEKENRLGSFISIIAGRALGTADMYQILLGEGVARSSGLRSGDSATLLVNTTGGALNTLDFEIVGIFRSFSKDYDARTVRIPLAAARELLDVDAANAIVVSLRNTDATEATAAALRQMLRGRVYEVKTWDELADFYGKTAALYRRQFAVLQTIILIAVLLSVANSINMSTFDRIGEFGTLRALGNRRGTIVWLVLSENVLLGFAGALAGTVIGAALALAISAIGIPMPPPPNSNAGYVAVVRIVPRILIASVFVGFVATIAAALWPAVRVARLPIVDALRENQ